MSLNIKHVFAVIFSITFSCHLHAATVVKIAVDITNKDKSINSTHIITTDGDKVRVDYLGGEEARTKSTPYLLTLDAGKSWIVGNQDKDEFYCAQVKMEDFFKDLGEIIAKVDAFANVTYEDDEVKLISEEPGPVMFGYKTTHVKIQTMAKAKASIFFKKFDFSVKKIDEVWFVKDQVFHVAKNRWIHALTNSGYGELDKLTSGYRAIVIGPTLRHESEIEVINNNKNKTDIYRRNLKVLSIDQVHADRLPIDVFVKSPCENMNKRQLKNAAKTMFKENKLTL